MNPTGCELRRFEASDYPLLESWWRAHGWPPVPLQTLPPFAWIAYRQNTPQAFACAYMDNGGTGVAMIEWVVTNPNSAARDTVAAITTVITFMRDHLRDKLDYPFILATCGNPALSRLLQKLHFKVTDNQMIHHLYLKDHDN